MVEERLFGEDKEVISKGNRKERMARFQGLRELSK